MTKAHSGIQIVKPEPKPIAKMITPGRRALGEQWREVTIAVEDDEIKVTENGAAEAPPDNTPIYTFGMATLSTEAVNHILEGSLKEQEYRKHRPRRRVSDAEIEEMVNRMWQDWCEQKLKWFRGQTTIGPAGINQRQSPGRTNWTGVNPR